MADLLNCGLNGASDERSIRQPEGMQKRLICAWPAGQSARESATPSRRSVANSRGAATEDPHTLCDGGLRGRQQADPVALHTGARRVAQEQRAKSPQPPDTPATTPPRSSLAPTATRILPKRRLPRGAADLADPDVPCTRQGPVWTGAGGPPRPSWQPTARPCFGARSITLHLEQPGTTALTGKGAGA